MRRAIREHLRDFVAIVTLTVLGLAVTVAILSQQQAPYPEWIPFLGDERFELKAEFSTAQAVTPGQGQTVTIAGVEVGDVTEVELEDGRAMVTMLIEDEFAPLIHPDASILLRPRTGLQDMTLAMDIGTGKEAIEEDATIPVAQTDPNVQPDQILASLDADTQAYLKLLVSGGGEGLGGRGRELSAGLRRLEPFARDLARINTGLAERRENVRRAIHNFRLLSDELGRRDQELAEFVDSSNAVLSSFANQEQGLRRSLQELPGTLRETRGALESSNRLALELAPALRDLTPGARALGPALRETRSLFRETTGPIRTQIRPFTRKVRKPVKDLERASRPLEQTAGALRGGFAELNRLFNALAFNPEGEQEGFLFWLAWLNHNLNAIGFVQDANGPIPRALVEVSCEAAGLAEGVATENLTYETLLELTRVPTSTEIQALGGC